MNTEEDIILLLENDSFDVVYLRTRTFDPEEYYAIVRASPGVAQLDYKWRHRGARLVSSFYLLEDIIGVLGYFKTKGIQLSLETELWLEKNK